MIAGDVTSVIHTQSICSNGGQTPVLENIVAQSQGGIDNVTLSQTAMGFVKPPLKEDSYKLTPNFRLAEEDYQLSEYEKNYFKTHTIIGINHGHNVKRTVEDYKAVLRALAEHKQIIAANLNHIGKDKKITCYIMAPKDTTVMNKEGNTAKVKARDKNFIKTVLCCGNFDRVMKNEGGEYKNPSEVNLSALWGVEFYKTENQARHDLSTRLGNAFKWYHTPRG